MEDSINNNSKTILTNSTTLLCNNQSCDNNNDYDDNYDEYDDNYYNDIRKEEKLTKFRTFIMKQNRKQQIRRNRKNR
jgi:hypothetical protein